MEISCQQTPGFIALELWGLNGLEFSLGDYPTKLWVARRISEQEANACLGSAEAMTGGGLG